MSTFNVERLNFIVGEIIVDEIRRLHSLPRQGHDECNWALPPIDFDLAPVECFTDRVCAWRRFPLCPGLTRISRAWTRA